MYPFGNINKYILFCRKESRKYLSKQNHTLNDDVGGIKASLPFTCHSVIG